MSQAVKARPATSERGQVRISADLHHRLMIEAATSRTPAGRIAADALQAELDRRERERTSEVAA